MTDTSALIEGHHLVTSYPAAWCQCHHALRWETRAEDHAAHVVVEIQAQAVERAADKAWMNRHSGASAALRRYAARLRAARLTATTEEPK